MHQPYRLRKSNHKALFSILILLYRMWRHTVRPRLTTTAAMTTGPTSTATATVVAVAA